MKIAVVIPNWNGAELISECLKSLEAQSIKVHVIVVDNGSTDNSIRIIEQNFPKMILLKNSVNLGFSGGVNTGLRYALSKNYDCIGLFNNDAVADKDWAKELCGLLQERNDLGAVAGKLLKRDGKLIDSTGDLYSSWGLPIARQRNELATKAIQDKQDVFGATAGACMYKSEALKQNGLFDEKFFAYYEDTDFNFRFQLNGWKIAYTPKAIAYHAIGGTSSKLSGFTTYQTMKNLPMLFFKDVPLALMPRMLPRFFTAYYSILFNSFFAGRGWPALKGHFHFLGNIPHVISERRKIQKNKKVNIDYIWSIIYKDLPPDAQKLRRLRSILSLGRI